MFGVLKKHTLRNAISIARFSSLTQNNLVTWLIGENFIIDGRVVDYYVREIIVVGLRKGWWCFSRRNCVHALCASQTFNLGQDKPCNILFALHFCIFLSGSTKD
jgi:hypothetical protein